MIYVDLVKLYGPMKSPFQKYMESDEWNNKKEAVLKRDQICQLCNMGRSSEVQHPNLPLNLTAAREPARCLIAVCRSCRGELAGQRAEREKQERDEYGPQSL